MAGFNKVILIGRMTADPELKQTTSGVSTCSFCIAVDRRKGKDEAEAKTDFINIQTWRSTAEFVAKYFKKGNPIVIVGQIQTRSFTDDAGNKRTFTDVVADEANFLPYLPKQENTASNAPAVSVPNAPAYNPFAQNQNTQKFEEIPMDDSLPF